MSQVLAIPGHPYPLRFVRVADFSSRRPLQAGPMTETHLPPAPRLALRVGITGHRLVRLLEPDVDLAAVRSAVQAILAEVRRAAESVARDFSSVYADAPLLRVISPLAEGSDQLA